MKYIRHLSVSLSALLTLSAWQTEAQTTLTLSDCYQKAALHHPIAATAAIAQQNADLAIANARTGWLPQGDVTVQATYQSAVSKIPVSLPIPGLEIPSPYKDQYKATLDARQLLYDGGTIGNTVKLQQATASVQVQQSEVEVYKVRERVNQVYFGILTAEAWGLIADDMIKDLDSRIEKAAAAVKNGVLLESGLNQLKAEKLKALQRKVELSATRTALLRSLSLLIGDDLPEQTTLAPPREAVYEDLMPAGARPELALFEAQKQQTLAQERLIQSKNLPKLAIFGQVGYGRPGLNFLDNKFAFFGLGGIRATWSIGGLYTAKREREQLSLNRQLIDRQQEAFELGNNVAISQQQGEIIRLRQTLELDRDIVGLRSENTKIAAAQLENGVITPAEYITEMSAEAQAKENLQLHEIQLLQAQINMNYLQGIR